MRHSIQGKRVGLSSTGGLITKVNTGVNSTLPHGMAAQMWGESMARTVTMSTVNSTLDNYGTHHLTSTGSTSSSAPVFELARPELGVKKTIHIDSSSSEFSLGGTSTAIVFASTYASANGSTMFLSKVNLAGTVIQLEGVSTARWMVSGSTTSIVVG